MIVNEAALEAPAAVLTVTVVTSPGVTCQMPPGPLGVGTVKVMAVSLQLLTWNSAPSPGRSTGHATTRAPSIDRPPHSPVTRHAPPSKAASTDPSASATRGVFSLVVKTRSGEISTRVAAISVASNQPVDPPHATAEQWNTAVWVRQSSYPSASSTGTSYVYGHACHYHVCSFTQLKDVRVGDQVSITTPSQALTYRVRQTGLSPKAASSLPSWASRSTVPDRVVLVTCAFEQGDTSTDNLVVVAQLQSS